MNHDSDFTVTLTDNSTATASDLKTINTATSGIITATGVETITGSISDINDVLAAETSQGNAGQQIDLDTNFTVTVTDTGSIAATTLTTLDSGVPGTVTATTVDTLTGTAAQVAAAASACLLYTSPSPRDRH